MQVSSQVEPLQVSKWVKIPMLLDLHEMEDLLMNHTPPFKIYDVQKITGSSSGIYEPVDFLEGYGRYVACLKRGDVPNVAEYNALFSAAWSINEDAFVSMPTQDGRRLLKAITPVVQIQLNQIRYAPEEKVFRTQVFGSDTLCWGIQIGFPHLFLDPQTYEATHTRAFPNMSLFLAIQRWTRHHTVPTPFVVHDEKINSPVRLGKACFSWITSHFQLKQQNIQIEPRPF